MNVYDSRSLWYRIRLAFSLILGNAYIQRLSPADYASYTDVIQTAEIPGVLARVGAVERIYISGVPVPYKASDPELHDVPGLAICVGGVWYVRSYTPR